MLKKLYCSLYNCSKHFTSMPHRADACCYVCFLVPQISTVQVVGTLALTGAAATEPTAGKRKAAAAGDAAAAGGGGSSQLPGLQLDGGRAAAAAADGGDAAEQDAGEPMHSGDT